MHEFGGWSLRKMQHEGVDLSPMKLCFLLLSLHLVIHDWLIKDGGSMTLWQITAKIEPKLEHYVRNLRLDDDVKYMKWVMFLSRIDILHWIVKEMSFNPKNEVLDFRAPLGVLRSVVHWLWEHQTSLAKVAECWDAQTSCSGAGTLIVVLGRSETTIFLPKFEYNGHDRS